MSQNAPKISGLSGSFDVSRKTATVTADYNVLVVDDVVIQTVAGHSLFLPLNPTQGLAYLLLASGVATTINGNGKVINGLATIVLPIDSGLIVAWDVDSTQWVGVFSANPVAGGDVPYTFIFKPGAGVVPPPTYSDPALLRAALLLVPGPKLVEIDSSAQAFAPVVFPAAQSPWPLGDCTLCAANEDAASFPDGSHIDPNAVLLRLAAGISVFNDGTTPTWAPVNPFVLLLITEESTLASNTAAAFFHATVPLVTGAALSLQLNQDSFLGDGVHPVISVDAAAKVDVLGHSGSTIGAHASNGAGAIDYHISSDVVMGSPQDTVTTTIILASQAKLEEYTPAVPGNWSPVPANVSDALDQLASKVGSLFPTFGLTMYVTSFTENTVTGANVTEVIDQSTALHLLVAAGTIGPTQTATGIGTLTTWHFDHTTNGGAGNKLLSEGPAASNTPTTEFYLGDSDWTIGAIFKANGAALHNFNNNATAPTLFGTTSGSNPPLGAGLICGLNPGDPTKVQVSGYVTDGASVMHSNPAQADVANGHYVIAEFTGGTLSTYLDSLPAVTTLSGPIGDHTNQVAVGRNQASTSSCYDGELAIVLTWNRGLTSSERTQVQNGFRALSGLP